MFSRGNGLEGQDISHLVPFVRGLPKLSKLLKNPKHPKHPKGLDMAVRGELIISKDRWKDITHVGANARNVVAGVMHSKTPHPSIAYLIDFVAYELLKPIDPEEDMGHPQQQLALIDSYGFTVVHHGTMHPPLTTDKLSSFLLKRRAESPYEIDGIVVAHANAVDKNKNKNENKNPDNVFAFKTMLTHEQIEVTVVRVEWNVSKDGLIKPIVHYNPVKIAGATLQKATGFNGSFIERHKIGPGSKIVIIRSGDVIPKIERVVSPSTSGKPSFPDDLKYEWNETHVDLVLVHGDEDHHDVVLKRMEHLVATLEIPNVGPGTLHKVYEGGIDTIAKLIHVTADEIERIDGFQSTSATKIAEGIRKAVAEATWIKWMVASNSFGRGFGERKMSPVLEAFPDLVQGKGKHIQRIPTIDQLKTVDGIGKTSAKQFLDNLPGFFAFMREIDVTVRHDDDVIVKKSSQWSGTTVVFTGFRNKDWEREIEEGGGKIASTVSSKTDLVVAADVDDKGSKVTRARELGVRIVGKDEFDDLLKNVK
jgi:NAD-dependent DNA ligase